MASRAKASGASTGSVPVVGGGREKPYHSFARVSQQAPWLDQLLADAAKWARTKGLADVYIGVGDDLDHETDKVHLTVRQHPIGADRAARIEWIETNPQGTWTVEIVAVEKGREGWVSILATSAEGRWVATPRLAREVFRTLHLLDGGMDVSPDPEQIGPERVDELISMLLSEDRRGPAFVAGTDNQLPFEAFRERLGDWTKEVSGLAHVVILTPPATEAFSELMGPALDVHPWTIRTYRPGMTMNDPFTAHRMLTTGSLARERDGYLRHLLGRVARDAIDRQDDQPELLATLRRFDRLENQRLSDALTKRRPSKPAAAPAPLPVADDRPPAHVIEAAATNALLEEYTREFARIKEVLGISDLTTEALTAFLDEMTAPSPEAIEAAQRLNAQGATIARLHEERQDLIRERDDALEDYGVAVQQRDDAVRRASWLDRELATANPAVAFMPLPPDEAVVYPESFDAIFDRAEELESGLVILTADRDNCADIDAHALAMTGARNGWNALRALMGYVRACNDDKHAGDVDSYLKNTPAGYPTFDPGKHARGETDATMAAYGDERLLPVPNAVDPSGRVHMTSHFRLGNIGGRKPPRLYYLDDLNGTGKIYVGYIGAHMRNTQTN